MTDPTPEDLALAETLAGPDKVKGGCGGCGGPHRFDTSVPSVAWNAVIRAKGLSEYLCTSCILREFVREGRSFTAELYGDGLSGVPVEFRIAGQVATDAAKINDENNNLRAALDRIRGIAQDYPASHLTHAAIQDIAEKELQKASEPKARAEKAEAERDALREENERLRKLSDVVRLDGMWQQLVAERDAAIRRAEKAESERDAPAERVRRLEEALCELTSLCNAWGIGGRKQVTDAEALLFEGQGGER